jgi:hypothetical protein
MKINKQTALSADEDHFSFALKKKRSLLLLGFSAQSSSAQPFAFSNLHEKRLTRLEPREPRPRPRKAEQRERRTASFLPREAKDHSAFKPHHSLITASAFH